MKLPALLVDMEVLSAALMADDGEMLPGFLLAAGEKLPATLPIGAGLPAALPAGAGLTATLLADVEDPSASLLPDEAELSATLPAGGE